MKALVIGAGEVGFDDARTLAESEIGARTGLSVVALAEDGEIRTDLSADTKFHRAPNCL